MKLTDTGLLIFGFSLGLLDKLSFLGLDMIDITINQLLIQI